MDFFFQSQKTNTAIQNVRKLLIAHSSIETKDILIFFRTGFRLH